MERDAYKGEGRSIGEILIFLIRIRQVDKRMLERKRFRGEIQNRRQSGWR